jgi:hypothetical protein
MAKGKLDTPILGVALGVQLKDVSTGPFAQFQNCGDDEDSLIKLVIQLVNRIPNSEPDRDTIKFQVGKFKESISKIFAQRQAPTPIPKKSEGKTAEIENSSARLFEEIKIMFQDLPSRIEKTAYKNGVRSKKRRFHPMMIEEFSHFTKNPVIGLKIALSIYRDKMPWIYDEGMALINKVSSSKTGTIDKKAFMEFEELVMMSIRHPMMEDYLIDSEDDYFMIKELPRVILKGIERIAHLKSTLNE